MRGALAAVTAFAPLLAAFGAADAQTVVVRDAGVGRAGGYVDSLVARPYALRSGRGPLVLPRDSTITTSLLVIGQPTYLASQVRGDVVVVGADLYLRPGSDISGRAVAIGGTVAVTALGRVGGEVVSLRDETLDVTGPADRLELRARTVAVGGEAAPGVFRFSGIKGVKIPAYDRVDGLSLPVGVQLVPNERLVVEPTLTYRSRLGKVDPGITLLVGRDTGVRFEGRAARDTRTNEGWISGALINSLKTFFFGTDVQNYFRSDVGEGRVFGHVTRAAFSIEPFVGARFERVSPITSVGNVYSVLFRSDTDKVRRPNPLVEEGHIASGLVGARLAAAEDANVHTAVQVEAEQSFTSPARTGKFLQVTFNGAIDFPTFGMQRLAIRAHAVGTRGDSVPRSRYVYLGGSRTLGLLQPLERGGAELLFVDSRYTIPVERIQLPKVGAPTLSLIHRIGGAGVRSVGPLDQEVGVGVGISLIDVEVITGASGQNRTQVGVSVHLPAF